MYFITEIQKAHEKRIGCCDKKEAAYPQPLKLPCRKEEQQGLYFPENPVIIFSELKARNFPPYGDRDNIPGPDRNYRTDKNRVRSSPSHPQPLPV